MIYEGVNGVQVLDLVGCKLVVEGGKLIMVFFEMVKVEIKFVEVDEVLKVSFVELLKVVLKDLQVVVMYFMDQGMKNFNVVLLGFYDFMYFFGYVVFGLMWMWMVVVVSKVFVDGIGDMVFFEIKIVIGCYYMVC